MKPKSVALTANQRHAIERIFAALMASQAQLGALLEYFVTEHGLPRIAGGYTLSEDRRSLVPVQAAGE